MAFGIPIVIYAVFTLSTDLLSDFVGFIVMAVAGAVYWTVVEQHANMRFAWIKKNSPDWVKVKRGPVNRILFVVYNVVYWIPFVLPFTGAIEYRTGFIALFSVILLRAFSNLYRNNFLKPEQAESFPLQSP